MLFRSIATRLILPATIVVNHSDLEELINHFLRQRINPSLQHLQGILVVFAIALTAFVVLVLTAAAIATRMLVVFLLTLPNHHEEESGDEVDGQKTADDGQQALRDTGPWRVADTEENGVFAFAGVIVVVTLPEQRRALIGGHRAVCIVITVWHVIISLALNFPFLAETRLIEVIVVMKR